jgi:(p)ppGpp synthase/HD superfamily hydrolase
MLSLSTEEERIVGVLHDVVEDCSAWSFPKLRAEGFSETVIEALKAVTKLPEDEDQPGDDSEKKRERYFRFVSRAASNPIGRRVKLSDLRDNCDLTRISRPTEKDRARIAKYEAAIAMLETKDEHAG